MMPTSPEQPANGAQVPGQQAQQLPPVDTGNPHLAPTAASLSVSNVKLSGPEVRDGGDRVLATFRVGPATVSVFLSRTDAEQWAAMLAQGARQCSPLVIPS
jgi:hypothetical protein